MNMQWGGHIDMGNRIVCAIQDGRVCQLSNTGELIPIGHTNERFDELVKITQEYKQLCIDNNLIMEEKTPEQVQAELMATIQQQSDAMLKMMEAMEGLTNKVEVLENGRNATSDASRKVTGSGQPKATNSTKTSKSVSE